jgi:hypothetical protein
VKNGWKRGITRSLMAASFLRAGSSFTSRMISSPSSHILSTWFWMVLFDRPDPAR